MASPIPRQSSIEPIDVRLRLDGFRAEAVAVLKELEAQIAAELQLPAKT